MRNNLQVIKKNGLISIVLSLLLSLIIMAIGSFFDWEASNYVNMFFYVGLILIWIGVFNFLGGYYITRSSNNPRESVIGFFNLKKQLKIKDEEVSADYHVGSILLINGVILLIISYILV